MIQFSGLARRKERSVGNVIPQRRQDVGPAQWWHDTRVFELLYLSQHRVDFSLEVCFGYTRRRAGAQIPRNREKTTNTPSLRDFMRSAPALIRGCQGKGCGSDSIHRVRCQCRFSKKHSLLTFYVSIEAIEKVMPTHCKERHTPNSQAAQKQYVKLYFLVIISHANRIDSIIMYYTEPCPPYDGFPAIVSNRPRFRLIPIVAAF